MSDFLSVFDPAVTASDGWEVQEKRLSGFRRALQPVKAGARITYPFHGTAISLVRAPMWRVMDGVPGETYGVTQGNRAVRPGRPIEGKHIIVRVDGAPREIRLDKEPVEIPLAENLSRDAHTLELVCAEPSPLCVLGFRVLDRPYGCITGRVTGDEADYFGDVRVVVVKDGDPYDRRLARNPFTGRVQLWGLEPGAYDIEISALGWQARRIAGLRVEASGATDFGEIHLKADPLAARRRGLLLSPNRGHPVFVKPGDAFTAHVTGGAATLSLVTELSRVPLETERTDDDAVACRVPNDAPAGLYHLECRAGGGVATAGSSSRLSPRSEPPIPSCPVAEQDRASPGGETELGAHAVMVRDDLDAMRHLRIVKFGHMDTWHQRNAEYVRILVELTNLIQPDLLLVGNECNWPYVAGALAATRVPYMVTSGNHGMPGFSDWFGDPLGAVQLGPVFAANFGDHWQSDKSRLEPLFARDSGSRFRVLQGVEVNVPREIMDSYDVRLYCYAHGFSDEGPELRTWTHLGKEFHVVDVDLTSLDVHVASGRSTNVGMDAKYPIRRDEPFHPVAYDGPNDGTASELTATVRNPLNVPLPGARVRFLLPKGRYGTNVGEIVRQLDSDDGRFTEVDVEVSLHGHDNVEIAVGPVEP